MYSEILKKLVDRKWLCSAESAELLGDLVNGAISYTGKEFTDTVKRQHRYLQSELFVLACRIMKALAENHESESTDARNEYACQKASEVVNLLDIY